MNVNIKKISAEQKFLFHRLWDVSETSGPGRGEAQELGVRQACAGTQVLPKTRCTSLGLALPAL